MSFRTPFHLHFFPRFLPYRTGNEPLTLLSCTCSFRVAVQNLLLLSPGPRFDGGDLLSTLFHTPVDRSP